MPRKKLTLLQQISKVSFLKEAWGQLNTSNKASKGLSKQSIKDFESNLSANLIALSKDLIKDTYKFDPVKGVALEKKNKGFRPLLISEVRDRVVHKALAIKLQNKLAGKYKIKNRCSFAYQKNLSIKDAIKQMVIYYQQGYKYILEADIQNFFPTVDKEALLKDIFAELTDNTLNKLLNGSLTQELGNRSELENRDKKIYDDIFLSVENGIPQGNALSPLLANIFLSKFDQRMIKERIKMIRYADDFIIMCKTKAKAKAAYDIAIDELETKLNLKLYPLKETAAKDEKISRILKPTEQKFEFLSIKFDGFNCSVSDKKVLGMLQKLNDLSTKRALKENFPDEKIGLLQALTKIKNAIEGWIAAYSFLDIDRQIVELDKHVNIALYNLFREFGLKLAKSSSAKIRTQKRIKVGIDEKIILERNSNQKTGLNSIQRQSTGIPSCFETYTKTRSGVTFSEIIALSRITKKSVRVSAKADDGAFF